MHLTGYKNRLGKKNELISIPLFLWIVLAVCSLVIMCLHTYNDILITAKQGYTFWDLLFEGRPLDFYKEASMATGNAFFPEVQGAAYSFPLYFIFAVWNFPTWLLEKIFGVSLFNSIPSMIWMKLMLVPFIVISAVFLYKIVKRTESIKEYAMIAAFLFASSTVLIYSTALIGQYDIITVSFIVIGLEGWLTGNKKRFLISFAVALWFKYFALLYFVPLLLLSEKRIRKILLYAFQVCLPLVPFLLFPKPKTQGSNVTNTLGLFFNGITLDQGVSFYVFPAVVLFVLIMCFLKKATEQNKFQYAVFSIFVIMGSFCVFNNLYPYWCILAVPVFVLVPFVSNNMNKLVILETVFCAGIAVKEYIINPTCFGAITTEGMGVLPGLLGKTIDKPYNVSLLGMFQTDEKVNSVVFTGLVLLFVLMIFFSRPNAKPEPTFEPFCIKTVYARTAINLMVAIAPTLYIIAYMILKVQ